MLRTLKKTLYNKCIALLFSVDPDSPLKEAKNERIRSKPYPTQKEERALLSLGYLDPPADNSLPGKRLLCGPKDHQLAGDLWHGSQGSL